ncbi:MAG: hypothetical protein HY341_02970 [Candidatus Kerfeldbacteria bacterium]|nr:hypothetical protein [Candidatus Kerfeldbacteria bacterium]
MDAPLPLLIHSLIEEHRTFRAEVRMFDWQRIIAAFVGFCGYALFCWDRCPVSLWPVGLFSVFLALRGWASHGEKFRVLRQNASLIRRRCDDDILRYDAGLMTSQVRRAADILFFGSGMLFAVLTILGIG